MYFSTNTSGRPKALIASRWASSSLPTSSPSFSTTRMPRPPPPKLALMITGNPMRRASATTFFGSLIASSVPGTVGTFAASAIFFASVFSPKRSSSAGDGPTNVMPAASHARANSGRSLRKP